MCLFVRVTADTHMPQHPCVATRGQARVSVLAFHLLFVVGCCAHQAGWPRGSRTSVCLPVSPQEGWMTKHPSLCGFWVSELRPSHTTERFTYWTVSRLEIFLYIMLSKRQKSLLWLGCFPKIHVLETIRKILNAKVLGDEAEWLSWVRVLVDRSLLVSRE